MKYMTMIHIGVQSDGSPLKHPVALMFILQIDDMITSTFTPRMSSLNTMIWVNHPTLMDVVFL